MTEQTAGQHGRARGRCANGRRVALVSLTEDKSLPRGNPSADFAPISPGGEAVSRVYAAHTVAALLLIADQTFPAAQPTMTTRATHTLALFIALTALALTEGSTALGQGGGCGPGLNAIVCENFLAGAPASE